MSLYELFLAHRGRLIDKWEHYFPIYDRHFAKYVGKSPRVLEIGVSHGGSLQLWKQYFGPGARITGIDIDPRCKEYEEDQISVIIEDQTKFRGMEPWDIVIDDGSHERQHQAISFSNLWPRTLGVYLIEDCHRDYPCIQRPEITFLYPWVMVMERQRRMIRGKPSRELRPDEQQAWELYGSEV